MGTSFAKCCLSLIRDRHAEYQVFGYKKPRLAHEGETDKKPPSENTSIRSQMKIKAGNDTGGTHTHPLGRVLLDEQTVRKGPGLLVDLFLRQD